jgi:hypothetical protein
MKFENKEEKKQFTKTLLQKGLQAARTEYIQNNPPLVVVIKDNPQTEILGETLTAEEAKEKYPNVIICKVNDEQTKHEIENLGK